MLVPQAQGFALGAAAGVGLGIRMGVRGLEQGVGMGSRGQAGVGVFEAVSPGLGGSRGIGMVGCLRVFGVASVYYR